MKNVVVLTWTLVIASGPSTSKSYTVGSAGKETAQPRIANHAAATAGALANANIGVARAAYFPSLMLSGGGGFSAAGFQASGVDCVTGASFLHPLDAHRPRTIQFGLKWSF